MKGAASAPVRIPLTAPQPLPPPRYVTVQNGQTIERIASLYHVSRSAIVALNGLRPPYKPQPGARLMIPNTDEAAAQAAAHRPPPLRSQIAVAPPTPLPPAHPETLAPPPRIATNTPPASSSQNPPSPQTETASRAASSPAIAAPPTPAKATPEIIPLDGPRPKEIAAAQSPPPVLPPRNAAAALPLPGEASVDWASAYAGHEVKGYGNLVLIRHANGWISAYAHLDTLAVKVGDKITAGQAFARVGESGGVGEPQLHFELRRGKKPVDPKEFLAPAPSAAMPTGNKAG